MADIPLVRLNNGVEIPQVGFGVFQIPPDETEKAVRTAFDAGYRHIDTAQMYGNEEQVGRAIAGSGLDRDAVFVTTKLDNDRHGRASAATALDESLQRLGLDHVDLFLIHWPRPQEDRYVETWQGFEELAAAGKARAIGVSNFTTENLDRLAKETGTVPAVNQVEVHPDFAQVPLRAYHGRHGIATEAWSPIGQGGDLLEDERLARIAEKHGRSPAQVVLRWHLQEGNIVFPKSVTPSRIAENIALFDFALDADDVTRIENMDAGNRMGPDPDDFG